MMSVSVAAIVLSGCGASGTLSERENTTPSSVPSTAPSVAPSTTPSVTPSVTPSAAPTEEEINYVIQEKEQRLSSTRQEILKVHNERRRNEFGDSDLRYSIELEKVAQAYADELAKSGKREHDKNNAKNGYGENIFAHSTDRNLTIEESMRQWYDEEKKRYNYETGECNDSVRVPGNDAKKATCGHYTQVAWQETKEVGCALAQYTVKDKTYSDGSVYICRYKRAGNVVGEKPYCTNYVTNDIYTGTIPTINTKDITGRNLSIELTEEDRVNCVRTDNRNGYINFAKGFQSAQLIDFDIFNGTNYTTTLDFDKVVIEDNKVKLTGTGVTAEKYPIFMNIEFVGETSDYYGVELEWNGHNENNETFSRQMKAKFYK